MRATQSRQARPPSRLRGWIGDLRRRWLDTGQCKSIQSRYALNSRMCGKPVRRLEQAHRDRCVCDRTFVLARCGGCLSPAASTHTGRLLKRASLRSSRKLTRTGPRDPAAGAPPGSAAADAGTRTVAVSGAGADVPRTCRPATCRPGDGPNSEHGAGYPGAPARLVLLLLHDFPDPGRSHRNPCSSPSPRTR